jgi:histidinol phosphatase-like enzyme
MIDRIDKPKCILVDVDGTLAKMKRGPGERSPFDWHRVSEDLPNTPVINLVNVLSQEYAIIVLTGRDGIALEDTKDWLEYQGVEYDGIYIRPEGNNQKDSIIKHNIYVNHILPNYEVEFVLDDRDQVVNLWRSIGLTCLQVDYGNF